MNSTSRVLPKRRFKPGTRPSTGVEKSTRREELLLSEVALEKVYQLRRALHSLSPVDAIQVLLKQLSDTKSNDELIARPEVNAVFVSTPEGSHAAAVRKALELGKPVLVETYVDRSTQTGVSLSAANWRMVSQNRRSLARSD